MTMRKIVVCSFMDLWMEVLVRRMVVLARRPAERAPSKKVDVKVRHCFSSVGTVIYDSAVAAFGNSQFFGDFRSSEKQVAD